MSLMSEAVLRSSINIAKRAHKRGAAPEELLWGPLNFMRWLQGYFLEEARTRITLRKQRTVEKYIRQLLGRLPNADFPEVCQIIEANVLAYGAEAGERKTKESVLAMVATMRLEYEH